jgi:hypothetical protein
MPMMLEKAQQFEQIIKNPKGYRDNAISWNDPSEI